MCSYLEPVIAFRNIAYQVMAVGVRGSLGYDLPIVWVVQSYGCTFGCGASTVL